MSLQFLQAALENNNVQAFLWTIRTCEGTTAKDGYYYLFGSNPHNDLRIHDLCDHPNIARPFGKQFSTAAGAYQILYKTWEEIEHKYKLPDFSPKSQDIACVDLISQRDCLQMLMDGEFHYAVNRCNTIWASLPGSPYGQPTKTIKECETVYESRGGDIKI